MDNIFSIGYGRKTFEEFVKELKSFDISYVVDIRSKPSSKWNPQFNQGILRALLHNENIRYVYMGDCLGGIPSDSSYYCVNEKINYRIIETKDYFKKGIERLMVADVKNIHIALMCSESDPAKCHRSELIGGELEKCDINLRHIIGEGDEESQKEVMIRRTKGKCLLGELFSEPEYREQSTSLRKH
jgi:uncharacterized protein (DUF488 family)